MAAGEKFPWERQKGESDTAFAAFCAYRDLGPERSLPKAGEVLGKSVGTLDRWRGLWNWVERASAYDDYLDAKARADLEKEKIKARVEQEKERTDMLKRHAGTGVALQAKAVERLNELKSKDLSIEQLLRYLLDGVKLERVSRGEPETINEQRTTGKDGEALPIAVIEIVRPARQLARHQKLSPPMPDLIERDGRKLRFNFHWGQARAWDSEKRFVAMVAGTQGGKTSFLPIWLWREIQLRGPGDYGFISPTFTLMETKALPEFTNLFEQILQLGKYKGSPVRKFTFSDKGSQRMFGRVPDVPTQVFFGYAENPDSLESATYKAAALDEAGQKGFKRGSFEAVNRRLAIHRGRLIIGTTPYSAFGWLRTEIYDRWIAGDPDVDVVQFPSTTNPSFPVEEYERARATLPAWKFDLFYRGLLAKPAGLIYDCFDEKRHIVPSFAIPDAWPRYLGLDFGGVNTAGVFFAAEPGTQRLFAYREYLEPGRTAAEHAYYLLEGEPMVPQCVGGSKSEQQWRDEFRAGGRMGSGRARGLPVREPPVTEVEVGIDRVYGAIKRNEIYVFSHLTGLIDEFQSYSRELDESGQPTEKIENKAAFHRCFVAGTLVETSDGPVAIERVKVGDLVLTRAGYRPVIAAGMTGTYPVRRVMFSDGATLCGTTDHPVFIKGIGFVPIDSLQYNDTAAHQRENPCYQKSKSSTALNTIGIQSLSADPINGISNGQERVCTGRSGNITTGQFLRVMTFTTRTKTPATTRLRIWRLFQKTSTIQYTTREGVRQRKRLTLTAFVRLLLNGIGLRLAASGISSMASIPGKMLSLRKELASIAGWFTKRETMAIEAAFAQTNAGLMRGMRLESITSNEFANSARCPSPATDTLENGIAPVRVVGLREESRQSVYNLTVADQHEYYANGILVSNCDAVRYIVLAPATEGGNGPTGHVECEGA